MIFILIPIHNRKELTLACLASFAKQTRTDRQFVIVDDSSTDGSGEAVGVQYPSATIIRGTGDWWWTKSMNEGMHSILQKAQPGDFVLTINNDVEVGPDYLQKLVETSERRGRALAGSLVKNLYDGSIQDAGVQARWDKFFFPKLEYDQTKKENGRIDALAGRGVLIPIEVFQKIGLYSTTLPHYAADYDFSMRAKRRGFTLVISYEAVVYSKDQPGDKQYGFLEKYFSRRSSSNLRAQLIIAVVHAPSLSLKFQCVARIFARFVRDLVVYVLKTLNIL
ncbi:MAG: glycosyltransferase family 2 protein [Patescibacteria group bacterium]